MPSRALEKILFASRWLLAPFYVALVVALVILMITMLRELWHFASLVPEIKEVDVILGVLTLVDLTLTGSLIVIVMKISFRRLMLVNIRIGRNGWQRLIFQD